MPDGPEQQLARSIEVAFRTDFARREATALQLAELLLDAVAAALALTRHEPAEPALAQLEALATQGDVFSWDGAPGWDVVLAQGLDPRVPMTPGQPVLDGLGANAEREQQRGELKRRARAEAGRLVSLGREAARFSAASGAGAEVLDQEPTLPAPAALVAAHASLMRLLGLASASSSVLLPEDVQAGTLPPPSEEALTREMDARDISSAQEEWLALLLARNPAAAQAPAFRTFYAGLSQVLRVAPALRRFRDQALAGSLADDPEALLGAVGGWQPVRWSSLRGGAPSQWIAQLCPAPPAPESAWQRLARECSSGLDLAGRLFFARDLSLTGFTTLAALLVARCASAVALWEELGGGSTA
jgi:hypothetical protein